MRDSEVFEAFSSNEEESVHEPGVNTHKEAAQLKKAKAIVKALVEWDTAKVHPLSFASWEKSIIADIAGVRMPSSETWAIVIKLYDEATI